MDWFLYDRAFRHERVKEFKIIKTPKKAVAVGLNSVPHINLLESKHEDEC